MQMKPFLPSFKRALDCSLPSCHVRDIQSTAEMHVRTAIQHGRSGGTGLLPDLAAAPLGQERPVPPALPCWIAYFSRARVSSVGALFMQASPKPRLRPGSRPVLFSGGRPLPASCYMLAGLAGFTSRHQSAHVRSVVAHSLPARFEICTSHESSLHDCIVSMQALAFAGSFHFAKSGPPPSLSRCSMTGSRTRAQQVEWCRCTLHGHVYTSQSDRLLFRLAALALRPSEGPQRSALVEKRTQKTSLLGVKEKKKWEKRPSAYLRDPCRINLGSYLLDHLCRHLVPKCC